MNATLEGKKIEIKTALVWSLIKDEQHPLLSKEEKQIFGAIPILEGLFPGIYYYIDVPLPAVEDYPPSSFHRVKKPVQYRH